MVALKGAGTVIADDEGRAYVNTTGNSGMATAGSGDVLAGLIGGLVAQGLGGLEAAVSGVHIHGLAGDLACEQVNKRSMIASDILSYVPAAMSFVTGDNAKGGEGIC